MKRAVRAAITETINAYQSMPTRLEELETLRGRLDEVRQANLTHHLELIESAKELDVQVLCMGELFAGPYFALHTDAMWFDLAEDAETGVTVQAMKDAARAHGIILIAPIYEQDSRTGRRFNTAVVIDEHGEVIGKYRKNHIPNGSNEEGSFSEGFYYERSDGDNGDYAANISKNRFFPVFKTSIGNLGISICYDRHFSYTMRCLAENGAEIVFAPSVTFGGKSRRMWEMEFSVDATRHHVFIGGSNRKGREAPWNQRFYGASFFVGPNGPLELVPSRHELVIADLPLHELVDPDPSGWNFPRDTRPDIA